MTWPIIIMYVSDMKCERHSALEWRVQRRAVHLYTNARIPKNSFRVKSTMNYEIFCHFVSHSKYITGHILVFTLSPPFFIPSNGHWPSNLGSCRITKHLAFPSQFCFQKSPLERCSVNYSNIVLRFCRRKS